LHFHVKAATGKQNGGQNNDKSASLIVLPWPYEEDDAAV
jgi:hypothetical protein